MVRRTFRHLYRLRCFLLFLTLYGTASGQIVSPPRIWNDKDLKEWATPVATLNIRPAYYSERDYYSAREGRMGSNVSGVLPRARTRRLLADVAGQAA